MWERRRWQHPEPAQKGEKDAAGNTLKRRKKDHPRKGKKERRGEA